MKRGWGNLQPTHRGYRYQDIATAYVLVESLLRRYDLITVDRKQVQDDRLDDLEIRDSSRRVRRQFKSSENPDRRLSVADFATDSSKLRMDRLVRSFVLSGTDAATEYRLCATWSAPDDPALGALLSPADNAPTIAGSSSKGFRLVPGAIWPMHGGPIWQCLNNVSREQLLQFSGRFVVELEMPQTSTTLTSPGPLAGCGKSGLAVEFLEVEGRVKRVGQGQQAWSKGVIEPLRWIADIAAADLG